MRCEPGRDGSEHFLQLERQHLLAELAHELGLLLDQDDLPLADHADALGHQLGLLDVMRGQDDGHARIAQEADHLPHVLPQLDIDAGRRLVEKQHLRLVRQGLGDQHAALHPSRQRHDLAVFPVPQRQVREHLLDLSGIGRLAEQAAAEADRRPDALERIARQLLRHQADHRARGAVVLEDVMAAHRHGARGRRHDAADDVDERCLAGAVRPQQAEDLAAANV